MQNPTKGAILLIGVMECTACGSICEPLNNAEIKVNELNLLLKINDNLGDLFTAVIERSR